MKKTGVLLIGDSIRLGYEKEVSRKLGDEFFVWGPEENCRFAKYTLNELGRWFERYSDAAGGERIKKEESEFDVPGHIDAETVGDTPDIIHWNNGLWDSAIVCDEDGMFTKKEEYVSYCAKILRELRKITPNVIFATTTPVKPGSLNQNMDFINELNDAILEYMKSENVYIDDLYSVVAKDIERYISGDCIHLSPEGIDVCSDSVCESVKKFAK